MGRDDLVYRLARAGRDNDRDALGNTMTALIAEAHAQQKHGHASRLADIMANANHQGRSAKVPSMLPEGVQSLLHEITPRRRLQDLVLGKHVRTEVKEFIREYSRAALLRSHSLEPRHTVLLIGPPGTGKTSMASALAFELGIPFLIVRYEGLVGSYLGETAARLQQIVDYASRFPCVLFFDEFDTVAKERGDTQETGEIKRVVSSLLLQMDELPSHCVVVCATNHPELLDRAVWRRFELRLELPLPTASDLREWFLMTEKSLGHLGITAQEFVSLLRGQSFSEVEAITLDARRKLVLSDSKMTSAEAFKHALSGWERRRFVGGGLLGGDRADHKNKPRTKRRQPETGAQSALSKGDLLSGSDEASRE